MFMNDYTLNDANKIDNIKSIHSIWIGRVYIPIIKKSWALIQAYFAFLGGNNKWCAVDPADHGGGNDWKNRWRLL